MIRKILASFFIVAAICLVLFYVTPVRGQWLDSLFSNRISRAAGIPIKAEKISLIRYSDLRLESLDYFSPEGESWVRVSGASLKFRPIEAMAGKRTRAIFSARDAVLSKAFVRKFPIGPLSLDKFLEDSAKISNLRFLGVRQGDQMVVRILGWESNELILKGGIDLENQKMRVLHLVLRVSDRFYEELPRQVRSRMIARPGGWREVRIIYRKNSLTVLGRLGPFFHFQWQ